MANRFYIDIVKLRTAMAIRNIRNFTELAKLSGISRNTISSICNGKSCSLATVNIIADALELSIKELVTDRG